MSVIEITALMPTDSFTSIAETKGTIDINEQAIFSQLMTDGIASVNDNLVTANTNLQMLALGKEISTHELMLSLEQAKYQLELSLEVRNKLVEGYQEIMRMQL